MALLGLLAILAAAAWAFGGARVRRARFAGSWYEGDPGRLAAVVEGLLGAVPPASLRDRVVGLVVPHAGYRWSGAVAAVAYAAVRGAPFERVLLLAPSHRVPFRGARVPDWDAYETPLGAVPVDREVCVALRSSPGLEEERSGEVAVADEREHSLELQLPFLQRALGNFRLVPVLVGAVESGSDAASIGRRLRALVDSRTLVVASSDLTHYGEAYGFFPFPPGDPSLRERIRGFDGALIEAVLRADAPGLATVRGRTGINACGAGAIRLLLEMFPRGYRGTLLEYRTSGEVSGDWSSSVSYAAIAFSGLRPVLSEEEARGCLSLAREAVAAAVLGRPGPTPAEESLPRALREQAGAFVTLRRGGELRGCVGEVRAAHPLWKAIAANGASAALRDGRFPPVRPEELDLLRVEVTVLGDSRRLEDPADLALGEEGAFLRLGDAGAVFLPQVATEQGWDRETFYRHLAHKAGLDPEKWREATIEAFGAAWFAEGEEPHVRPSPAA
ncbi:MAG TPA: AmmeMemoRadiSam system protein B [Planctomycetota bacterium]|nr:AmmeMemoRadiSam system protein B [Planctomycetota bacterium]